MNDTRHAIDGVCKSHLGVPSKRMAGTCNGWGVVYLYTFRASYRWMGNFTYPQNGENRENVDFGAPRTKINFKQSRTL